ncbi:MAG TPA: amylo-alpha-1,6-glucosidase, partial [Bacteroidales bacterium]|nr:amylo-alpha-1,6-glucosidase [Bacteroidales bacterium]
LKRVFKQELRKRVPRNNFENNLINSAQQFVVRKPKKTEIIAGFPWFGRWGRDTFIALPGLTLTIKDYKTAKQVIDTMLAELNGPLFPNVGENEIVSYNSVDTSLWFFWALQQYTYFTDTHYKIWEDYGKKMKLILEGYRDGTLFNIHMTNEGMIWAGEPGKALTWMDAIVNGKPVTPRMGMPVEVNALWYNAIMFSIEMAKVANDNDFITEWQPIAEKVLINFKNIFWLKDKGYLADCVNGEYKDWSVRPNMIFAVSLPYSPLNDKLKQLVVEKVKQELLTPRGLRTLSPKDPAYKGIYEGDQNNRDLAYHQGTVWPWLIGHYAEAYLKVYGKAGLSAIKKIYADFEPAITEYCIGTIPELYDGDPPHKPKGALSQAWSVAELLRMKWLIDYYEKL